MSKTGGVQYRKPMLLEQRRIALGTNRLRATGAVLFFARLVPAMSVDSAVMSEQQIGGLLAAGTLHRNPTRTVSL